MSTTIPVEQLADFDWPAAVGRAVKRALKDAGVTQREAARRIGTPRSTLSRRLSGRAPLYLDELIGIARLLGCSAAALIVDAEDELDAAR